MSDKLHGYDCKGMKRKGSNFEFTNCSPIRKTTAATFGEFDASQHARECKACMNRTATATERTKGVIWREIEDGAKQMSEGATPEQKRTAFMLNTPEGRRLYAEHREAERDKVEAAEPQEPVGGTAERVVKQLIESKIAELQKGNPGLTEAQGWAKVFADYPEVYNRYRMAQEIDRKRERES